MIYCECNFCIYNNKSWCSLKTISISVAGWCEDCMNFSMEDEVIEKYKKETLEQMEQRLKSRRIYDVKK